METSKELDNIAIAMRLAPLDAAKEIVRLRSAKDKAVNLHRALSDLLESYRAMVKDTDSDPIFGKHPAIEAAERALFECRHLADWERQ